MITIRLKNRILAANYLRLVTLEKTRRNAWSADSTGSMEMTGRLSPVNTRAAPEQISCVDNVKTRLDIAKSLNKKSNGYKEFCNYYWMDLGNGQTSGQCVLGTGVTETQPQSSEFKSVRSLKNITEIFNLQNVDEADSGPSCSIAEALEKQDLFMNSTLVQASANLIWNLLKDGMITNHGFFLNMEDFRMNPLNI